MWVGKNRIQDLSLACKKLNIKKPLLVTDKGLAKNKIILDAVKTLKDKNISVKIFSEVIGNPTGTNVNDGVNDYAKAFTISVSDILEPITDVGFSSELNLEYLIVAGGGGGGYRHGSGGGAGGLLSGSFSRLQNSTYIVSVGAGGAGGANSTYNGSNGSKGQKGQTGSTGALRSCFQMAWRFLFARPHVAF